MSVAKIIGLSAVAAAICGLIYFRGDVQRYAKMKRM
jgi:hypothetical protein